MSESSKNVPIAAFIGIDWADQEHAICVFTREDKPQAGTLVQKPEAISAWVNSLTARFGNGKIAIAVERPNGPLVHVLMQYENLLIYPINPKQLARYREAVFPSQGKDDPSDARLLGRFLMVHLDQLKALKPNDALTRKLDRLCGIRRSLVDDRTRYVLRLTSLLKCYYPIALELLMGEITCDRTLELIKRWPTHKQLKRAHPGSLRRFLQKHGYRNEVQIDGIVDRVKSSTELTGDAAINDPSASYAVSLVEQIALLKKQIEQFDQHIREVMAEHEDAALFRSLPGAGAALAPRLLVAFGSERDRFASAEDVQCFCGIAPVLRRSGQTSIVTRRKACTAFLRQTFHEFAHQTKRWSVWSKVFYGEQRRKGKKHQAAIRALAFKWIRIIFRMWKTRTPYDEKAYIESLKKRNSPIAKLLPTS